MNLELKVKDKVIVSRPGLTSSTKHQMREMRVIGSMQ
jgi:hypothetical protein